MQVQLLMIAFFVSVIRQFYSTGSRCENKPPAADYPGSAFLKFSVPAMRYELCAAWPPFIKPTPAMFIAGDNIRPPESQTSEKIP